MEAERAPLFWRFLHWCPCHFAVGMHGTTARFWEPSSEARWHQNRQTPWKSICFSFLLSFFLSFTFSLSLSLFLLSFLSFFLSFFLPFFLSSFLSFFLSFFPCSLFFLFYPYVFFDLYMCFFFFLSLSPHITTASLHRCMHLFSHLISIPVTHPLDISILGHLRHQKWVVVTPCLIGHETSKLVKTCQNLQIWVISHVVLSKNMLLIPISGSFPPLTKP